MTARTDVVRGVPSLTGLLRWQAFPPMCLVLGDDAARTPGARNAPRRQLVVVVVAVFIASCLLSGCQADVCPHPTETTLNDVLFDHATPKGRLDAGNYSKVKQASDLVECVEACCQAGDCDVVLFHAAKCYLISCNKTKPENCDPEDRTKDSGYAQTTMVIVRNYRMNLELSSILHSSSPSLSGVGDGGDGYVDNGDGLSYHYVSGSTLGAGEAVGPSTSVRACTLGLNECSENEECVPRNTRSKVGRCHCVTGYERNERTNLCLVTTEGTTLGAHVPISSEYDTSAATSTVSPPRTTAGLKSVPDKKSQENNDTSDITTPLVGSTSPPIVQLTVSAGENRNLVLPENSVALSAFVIPQSNPGEEYTYEWSTVSHPKGAENAVMADKNTATLKLSQLNVVGLYVFRVAVTAPGKYGVASVNVTVSPEPRINQSPVAMIKPPVQKVQLPNSVVLDGSVSTDDDKIVKYQWEAVTGPLQNIENSNNDVLILKGLVAGEYRFKLTVTDSDGASNSTFADVTVLKELDYQPRANAGSDVVISLPQNSVTLYGNLSTDDHGIVSYEWTKKSDDKLTADMMGVRSPVLNLSKLEQGDYVFTLKVTDASGQSSTSDVHVYVKPENNQPPVARTGTNQIIALPVSSATLDGSKSSDDQKIVRYSWKQISGPDSAVLQNADQAVATVSNLRLGEYQYKLTVYDEKGLQSEDTVTVAVTENANFAPTANAGGDQAITLPAWLVTLNGSQSSDDKGIVSWTWTRDEQSLSAGEVVGRSDQSSVLQLVNLVPGRYVFTLTVRDGDGEAASDTASVIVRRDVRKPQQVEVRIGASLRTFTTANLHDWSNQLTLLMRKPNQVGETQIEIEQMLPNEPEGELIILFYVYTVTKAARQLWNGADVKALLKRRMRSEATMLDYPILFVDTVVCQNNCSGHGSCDQATKHCVCDPYWMENFIRANFWYKEKNCDWSILYVVIVTFLLVVCLGASCWVVFYCLRRYRRLRPTTKRHRYQLLDDFDEASDKKIDMELAPRDRNSRVSSLMISESDQSSDEETLFVNHKPTNGHLRKTANGHIKNGHRQNRSKLKT